jgi:hypothetical protein
MGGAGGTYSEEEKFIQVFGGETCRRMLGRPRCRRECNIKKVQKNTMKVYGLNCLSQDREK